MVISASHNPAEDNGIKFFARDGMKLSDDLEDEIEAVLAEPAVPAAGLGTVERHRRADASGTCEHLVASSDGSLDGMRVVVDCANGAASAFAPRDALRRLGADGASRSSTAPTATTSTTGVVRCTRRSWPPRSCA